MPLTIHKFNNSLLYGKYASERKLKLSQSQQLAMYINNMGLKKAGNSG
jgi:hypothetical protein